MGWLEWSRELSRSRDVLERILALLLALAALADRASGGPAADHRNLLAILARGEAEARAFVIGMAQESGAPVEPAVVSVAQGQVERLAASFRALALILSAMLALARRFARLLPAGPQAGLPIAPRKSAGPKRLSLVAEPAAPDTS